MELSINVLKHSERNDKHRKISFLARSKWNSIENIISKALTDFDGNHDEFMLVINEETNYLRLKESIKTKNDAEWEILIERGKKIGIDEIVKQNERQSLELKIEV